MLECPQQAVICREAIWDGSVQGSEKPLMDTKYPFSVRQEEVLP